MKLSNGQAFGMTCLGILTLACFGSAVITFVAASYGVDPTHPNGQVQQQEQQVSKVPFAVIMGDHRLGRLKKYNGKFPFTPPTSVENWKQRSAKLRQRMQVCLGLWPMPKKTPLQPTIHGKLDRGDHTVEKVYFESAPGFYVTGNLYRPKNCSGKLPAVLSAHGHCEDGRFHDQGRLMTKQQIEASGEQFMEGGRSPQQARCVQLARMGCVVFHYDMIGYADSKQIPLEIAHKYTGDRPEMASLDKWGLHSPQADLHFQSVMGLQTWNSIRALDFLTSLEDVDPERIGVTGSSSGAIQTLMLCAIDPRPAVSFPAAMVSTRMQGGCTCEMCCGLRVNAGNVDFAALFAPKPMALSGGNSWTRNISTEGYPELQQLYTLLSAGDKVKLFFDQKIQQNYNLPVRVGMYDWFNKHLQLNHQDPGRERDYKRLTPEEMTVWSDDHPRPASGPEVEFKLLRWWSDDCQQQLAALAPHDAETLQEFKEVVGTAVEVLIGRKKTPTSDVTGELKREEDFAHYKQITGRLKNTAYGETLPIVLLKPKQRNGQIVIWVHEKGKAGLFQEDGQPTPEVQRLLAQGAMVIGVDLLYQGEFLRDGLPKTKVQLVGNRASFSAATFGYNDSLFARRVHDILSTVSYAERLSKNSHKIDLIGLEGVGPLAAAARTQAQQSIRRAVIDTGGFRFLNLPATDDPNFLPGGAKYGDLPGMLTLCAPQELWLAGENEQTSQLVQSAYQAAGKPDHLTLYTGEPQQITESALNWLLGDE